MSQKKILTASLIIIVILISFVISFVVTNNLLNRLATVNIQDSKNQVKELQKKEKEVLIEKTNFFEGKIIGKSGTKIQVENPSHLVDYTVYEGDMNWHNAHKVSEDGKLYVTASYLLFLEGVTIKDDKGKEVEISELKEGDTIYVWTKDITYTANTISTPIMPENIEKIERKRKD